MNRHFALHYIYITPACGDLNSYPERPGYHDHFGLGTCARFFTRGNFPANVGASGTFLCRIMGKHASN